MSEVGEELSVAEVAQALWKIEVQPSAARFEEPGWSFERSFEGSCTRCSGTLHLLGKPYVSNGRSYRYAALVCAICMCAFTMKDLGYSSRAALEQGPTKKPSEDARAVVGVTEVPSLESGAGESAPPYARHWAVPDVSLVEDVVAGAATELGAALKPGEDLPRHALSEPTSVEAVALRGEPGSLWMVLVRHEPLAWGCMSSEVRVVRGAGDEGASLHVATQECDVHRAAGRHHLPFALRVAAGAAVTMDGAATPFKVGNTTLETVGRLVAMLRSPDRTSPIILLSGAQARDRAEVLLPRVGGGALVATIDGDASWRLSEALGADMGCYAGAVRIYPPFRPGLSPADCPVWVSRRIAHHGWENAADDIVATVALAADAPRRPALEAELIRDAGARALRAVGAENERLRQQVEETKRSAGTSPDIDEIFDAQAAEIDRLQTLLASADQQREEQTRRIADLGERLEHEVTTRQGLQAALKHVHWQEQSDSVTEAAAPADETVDAAIERMGDPTGPLVCTENALKAWRAARYPDPARMLAALLKLEEAASGWRLQDADVGGRLAGWLHAEFGLRSALDDAGLERAGLDSFTFENKAWSRIPHVKVDDAKHANQVGRIYFAIDAANRRWVVDHVGQKLYGL